MSDPICPNCNGSILECQGFCEPGSVRKQVNRIVHRVNDDGCTSCGNPECTKEDLFYPDLLDATDAILSLFKIEGFVKVSKCNDVLQESKYYGHSQCTTCNGTGTIPIPLAFEDVDLVGMFEAIEYAIETGTVSNLYEAMITKTGGKIRRKM